MENDTTPIIVRIIDQLAGVVFGALAVGIWARFLQKREIESPKKLIRDFKENKLTQANKETVKMNSVECNICGGQDFETGPKGRKSKFTEKLPKCTQCESLERHRIIRDIWKRMLKPNFNSAISKQSPIQWVTPAPPDVPTTFQGL